MGRRGGWPPCPLSLPPPTSLFPWGVGPSHRHTPILTVERVEGGLPQPGTKKPNLMAQPSSTSVQPLDSSSCSHSPASTKPPTRGGGVGCWKSDSCHPSCAPSPSAQARTGYQDMRLGGQMGALMGRQPAGDRDPGAQRETGAQVGDLQTELGQPGQWRGLVGKVGGGSKEQSLSPLWKQFSLK